MSKYAVIKVGASQEKVSVGDILSVPANFVIESKTPILMSARTVSNTHLTLPTSDLV